MRKHHVDRLYDYVHNHLNESQGSNAGFRFQLSIRKGEYICHLDGLKFQLRLTLLCKL